MSYDPTFRRDTPLALKLKDRIRREGSLRIGQYVEACLSDAQHGYYVNKTVIGAAGDFVTAPEISQIFGELIGLWAVATWQQMGEPTAFNLVEFGPGRGTLMRDALRAMKVRPKILDALQIVLLDTSAPLKDSQWLALSDFKGPVSWPGKLVYAEHSELPAIFIGNEFLDTEPIEQFVRLQIGWAARTVGLDESGALAFGTDLPCDTAVAARLDAQFATAALGDICEIYSLNHDVVTALLQLPQQMAALLIDYGHLQSQPGDTLQAIRAHKFEHPLTSPGEADLTAQVDFEQIIQSFTTPNTAIDGPLTQGEFLGRLGIIERASKLMSANPGQAGDIEASVARLMSPSGMGSRFKVIGIRSATLPKLPGF